MRGDLPQTGFRSSVAGILWKLNKDFGGFTLQMCYIANLVILHWSKNKSAPSVLMLKQENCCIWRHLKKEDFLQMFAYSLQCRGLWARQPTDRHTSRTRTFMLFDCRSECFPLQQLLIWYCFKNITSLKNKQVILPFCFRCQVFCLSFLNTPVMWE